MVEHGWKVAGARWEADPEMGFYVWQEESPNIGRSHALWVDEDMVRHLSPEQLINVLHQEDVAGEMRIDFKVRIQERGDGYRVSPVPRRSGEFRKEE
jgi:hypothetical protein